MDKIIDWLMNIEKLASGVYTHAATRFIDDRDFCKFLARLAEDEKQHAEYMSKIKEYARLNAIIPDSGIDVDTVTANKVQQPLEKANELAAFGTLTKKQLLNTIVDVEKSEWNSIFLYVINNFTKYSKEFQSMAAAINAHEVRVKEFIALQDTNFKLKQNLNDLPPVWRNKFLVVDDNDDLLELYSEVLSSKADVFEARNGVEALDQMQKHFFNVVLSDIEMPEMDGISLYKKAVAEEPKIAYRYIFCTSELSSDNRFFLKDQQVPCLQKPVALSKLIETVEKVAKASLERM